MKIGPSHYLKWIVQDHLADVHFDQVFTEQCALISESKSGIINGFTIFEPRSFDQDFVSRLQKRRESDDASHWRLHLPEFLRHRFESFKGQTALQGIAVNFGPFFRISKIGQFLTYRNKIRIVSVDDSPVILKFLKKCFDDIGFVDVIRQTSDSVNAARLIEELSPDIVTLDIQMPGKTGVDVLKELVSINEIPVIMISSLSPEEGSMVFEALNAGAFDYIQKPSLESANEFKIQIEARLLAAAQGRRPSPILPASKKSSHLSTLTVSYARNTVWCFGASTGGTQALTQVFTSMPTKIPPTLVVQHIPPVYSKAFAESLKALCPFEVKEAVDGEILKDNCVYVAPGGQQMGLRQAGAMLTIRITDDPPVNRFKPSVDYLFQEVAKLKGHAIVAALLTGMGKDGAQGLLDLKNRGAYTIAQNEETCTVFGMPRAAIELGAAEEVLALDKFAEIFVTQSQQSTFKKSS